MSGEALEALCRSRGAERAAMLEGMYARFNDAGYRAGDPVSFVWGYASQEDREVAAWMAAAAGGRGGGGADHAGVCADVSGGSAAV
jgi:hypothetical protein